MCVCVCIRTQYTHIHWIAQLLSMTFWLSPQNRCITTDFCDINKVAFHAPVATKFITDHKIVRFTILSSNVCSPECYNFILYLFDLNWINGSKIFANENISIGASLNLHLIQTWMTRSLFLPFTSSANLSSCFTLDGINEVLVYQLKRNRVCNLSINYSTNSIQINLKKKFIYSIFKIK